MSIPVVILGSGAMACQFAARLTASGQPVRMLASWPEGIRAIQEHGVRVRDVAGKERSYPVEITNWPEDCQGARQAFVLVKAWQTERAGAQLARFLAPSGLAVTLQNGLGNYQILSEHLGPENVITGITTLGATLLEPGIVRIQEAGEIVLGEHPLVQGVLDLLLGCGLRCHVEKEMNSLLWGKLVLNAAINPVSALVDQPNGFLLDNPFTWALVQRLTEEAEGVVNELQIRLPYSNAIEQVKTVLRQTASNLSSMVQDTRRGAPTEIDAITGFIIQYGKEAGITVPTHKALYQLIKARRELTIDKHFPKT